MLHVLKKISNSLSTDNSIPIFGYSINEADIASASFFCVVTVLYKAAACPHSSTPDLTSRTKLRPLSHFPGVSSVHLLGCRSKRNVTWANTRLFCPRRSSLMLLAELRQEPALLRVLRNSPRAMPLSGFPIIVVHIMKTSSVTARLCLWISQDSRGQKSRIRTRGLRRSGATMGFRMERQERK